MQNSDFWSRITSLYVSQAWPVILCMYKSVLSIRITCLYGSQPSSVGFAYKTAHFGPELQVSMGARPHLWFLHAKQRRLDPNNKSLLVPDITCRFVHAKLRNYHQNNLSLWVPALICCFCMENGDFWSRITSLYGSLTSPVVLCMQNSVISIRITSL